MMFFKKGLAVALTVAIVLTGITYFPSVAKDAEAAENYELVWSDEFNNNALNRSNWNVEVNGDGGGNNELQYYRDTTENIEVSNGTLKIHALKQSYAGKNYTSGRITTQNKKTFKYGKVEARMKLPSFSGAWPAFWMLGSNISSVGWPKCGEIDIMEAINTESKVYGTVHWSYNYNNADSGKESGYVDRTQWHTYAVEWDEDKMAFSVDGNIYFTQGISESAQMTCFRKEHFIIFNLAIGGNWPGYNIDDSAFPNRSTMEVDYVRVYQKKAEESTKYEGPTITVKQDAVAESNASWGSFFGNADWCDYANGTLSNNSSKAADGATVNASRMGSDRWGIQASLQGLKYYPGNTYTYKCTLTSNKNKVVFVKVAGDDDDEISGRYVSLQAGVPYNYTAQVNIPEDYNGVLDLFFGLGRCDGDTIGNADGYTLNISNVSFTTTASIPDPNYVPPTTTKSPSQSQTTNSSDGANTTQKTAQGAGGKNKGTTLSATEKEKLVQFQSVGKAKIKKAKKKKSAKKLKVSLKKKVKGADGYQVRFYKKKAHVKNKKVLGKATYKKNKKKFKVTSKKLKKKKKLFIRVRGYIILGGKKYYGKWSAVKKVK